jgi:hypothetical protein
MDQLVLQIQWLTSDPRGEKDGWDLLGAQSIRGLSCAEIGGALWGVSPIMYTILRKTKNQQIEVMNEVNP